MSLDPIQGNYLGKFSNYPGLQDFINKVNENPAFLWEAVHGKSRGSSEAPSAEEIRRAAEDFDKLPDEEKLAYLKRMEENASQEVKDAKSGFRSATKSVRQYISDKREDFENKQKVSDLYSNLLGREREYQVNQNRISSLNITLNGSTDENGQITEKGLHARLQDAEAELQRVKQQKVIIEQTEENYQEDESQLTPLEIRQKREAQRLEAEQKRTQAQADYRSTKAEQEQLIKKAEDNVDLIKNMIKSTEKDLKRANKNDVRLQNEVADLRAKMTKLDPDVTFDTNGEFSVDVEATQAMAEQAKAETARAERVYNSAKQGQLFSEVVTTEREDGTVVSERVNENGRLLERTETKDGQSVNTTFNREEKPVKEVVRNDNTIAGSADITYKANGEAVYVYKDSTGKEITQEEYALLKETKPPVTIIDGGEATATIVVPENDENPDNNPIRTDGSPVQVAEEGEGVSSNGTSSPVSRQNPDGSEVSQQTSEGTPPPVSLTDETDGADQQSQVNDDIKKGLRTETVTTPDGKQIKVEYDGEGNTYAYVKEGETFRATAKRVLGGDATADEIQQFKDLNKGLVKRFGKVEAFHAGAKIKVPGEVQYDESKKEVFDVNPEAEKQKADNAVYGKFKAQNKDKFEAAQANFRDANTEGAKPISAWDVARAILTEEKKSNPEVKITNATVSQKMNEVMLVNGDKTYFGKNDEIKMPQPKGTTPPVVKERTDEERQAITAKAKAAGMRPTNHKDTYYNDTEKKHYRYNNESEKFEVFDVDFIYEDGSYQIGNQVFGKDDPVSEAKSQIAAAKAKAESMNVAAQKAEELKYEAVCKAEGFYSEKVEEETKYHRWNTEKSEFEPFDATRVYSNGTYERNGYEYKPDGNLVNPNLTTYTPEQKAQAKTLLEEFKFDDENKFDIKNPEHAAKLNKILETKNYELIDRALYELYDIDIETYSIVKNALEADESIKGKEVSNWGMNDFPIETQIMDALYNKGNKEVRENILKDGSPQTLYRIAVNDFNDDKEIKALLDRFEDSEFDLAAEHKADMLGNIARKASEGEAIGRIIKLSGGQSYPLQELADNNNTSPAQQIKIFDEVMNAKNTSNAKSSVLVTLAGNIKGTDEEQKAIFDKLIRANVEDDDKRYLNLELSKSEHYKDNYGIESTYIVQEGDSPQKIIKKLIRVKFPQGKMSDKEYNQKVDYIAAAYAKDFSNGETPFYTDLSAKPLGALKPGDAIEQAYWFNKEYKSVDDVLGAGERLKLWWNRQQLAK